MQDYDAGRHGSADRRHREALVERRGIVRFETNRALTGMGHERYRSRRRRVAAPDRPTSWPAGCSPTAASIAVHVNGNIVTVDLTKGHTSDGLKEIIESLYLYYPPSAEPSEPQHTLESELEPDAGGAPESTSDPGAIAAPEVSADEAPSRGGAEGDEGQGAPADDRAPARDERPAAGTLIEDTSDGESVPGPSTEPPPVESEDSAPTT